jgi:hypothetical protein
MKLLLAGISHIKAIKEPEDINYYGIVNAAGESKLLYKVKTELNKKGFELIKKRMWKDGHLVDDMQQYLKTREGSKTPHIYIYNTAWAINGLEDDWNKNGEVLLPVVFDVYEKQPNCLDMVKALLK